MENEKVSAGK